MLDKNKVEKFLEAAHKYNGDKYSQTRRMEKGFSDCSSLVQKSLRDIGEQHKLVTTQTMPNDSRFRQINMSELQRGDLLWGGDFVKGKWSGHVAIYEGNGKTFEAVYAGVGYNKNRPYFTKAYRIKALEGVAKPVEPPKPTKPVEKPKAIENVPIYVNGKLLAQKGYIVNSKTSLEVRVSTGLLVIPVREFFEKLGFKVEYKDEKVYIS